MVSPPSPSYLDRQICADYICGQKSFYLLNLNSGAEIKMKFLVGYNGSKLDERVLKLAQKHASVFNADVYILTSLEQSSTLQKADIEKAEGELEYLRTPFNIDDLNCETAVSVNYLSPGEDLVQFARDNNIDTVFIGIKKRSKVGKLMFGSTAQYVLLNAPCPVVAVR
jgi:nucleotide-binding universal stress UspA family protein